MANKPMTDLQYRNLKVSSTEKSVSVGGGLFVRIRSISDGGAKSFRMSYRIDGKQKWITLCTKAEKGSLAVARKECSHIKELLQKGLDPSLERKITIERNRQIQLDTKTKLENEAARLTLQQLFDKWKQQSLTKRRKDSGSSIESIFNRDVLPVLGSLAIDTMKKSDVMQVIDNQLARDTNRLPKLTLGLIRQMFRFAIDRDLMESDPTSSISKANIGSPDLERERTLSNDEIKALAIKLGDSHLLKTTQLAVWVMLSTCCRIGELCKAEWQHLDLEIRKWTIPEQNSKNGKPHIIYLSHFVAEIFIQLKQFKLSDKWLYPNRDNSNHLCTKSITKQISDRQIIFSNRTRKLKNRVENDCLVLGTEKWTPHDLRRTGATLMGDLGVRPDVIEKCLNHTEPNKIKRIYQRQTLQNEQNEAWRLLGEKIHCLKWSCMGSS